MNCRNCNSYLLTFKSHCIECNEPKIIPTGFRFYIYKVNKVFRETNLSDMDFEKILRY